MGTKLEMNIQAIKEMVNLICSFYLYSFCPRLLFLLGVMLFMNCFYGMILLYIAGDIY